MEKETNLSKKEISIKISDEIRNITNNKLRKEEIWRSFYPVEDVKEKIQNAQKRLKEEFDCMCEKDYKCQACEEIDKIFLEEFGEKLI